MKRFWFGLIVSIFTAVPALCVAQNLPGNLSCKDLLDVADGKASRIAPAVAAAQKTDAPVQVSHLIVGNSGAPLWLRQDDESKSITKLEKGEELTPLGYGVGTASWYMVRTQKGIVGWVKSSDVQGGDQLKKSPADALTISNTPATADAFTQTLLAYDTALCRRLVRGQISVDDFNALHSAKVLSLNAEKERMAAERQRLDLERKRVEAQEEAAEASLRLQRQTAEALIQRQDERLNRLEENQERQKREPVRCGGIVSGGGAVMLRCK
jgi:hypothetical protein